MLVLRKFLKLFEERNVFTEKSEKNSQASKIIKHVCEKALENGYF